MVVRIARLNKQLRKDFGFQLSFLAITSLCLLHLCLQQWRSKFCLMVIEQRLLRWSPVFAQIATSVKTLSCCKIMDIINAICIHQLITYTSFCRSPRNMCTCGKCGSVLAWDRKMKETHTRFHYCLNWVWMSSVVSRGSATCLPSYWGVFSH